METHDTTLNLALTTTSVVEEDLPSKHLQFLSFQIGQRVAIKESRHIILPLDEPIWSFQASNKSQTLRGRTQLHRNQLKIADQIW